MVVNKLESSFPRSSMIYPNQYSPSGFRTKDTGDMTVMEVACVLLCIKYMGSWGNRISSVIAVFILLYALG